MTLTWTLLGTLAQGMLAYFLFMMAAVVGGGLGNCASLGKLQSRILDLSLLALPGSCVASAGIVIALHVAGAGARAYWWYALPLAVVLPYLVNAVALTRRGNGRPD